MRRSVPIDVTRQKVVKFLPAMPPRRGDRVLVDGDLYRITRARVHWREPGVWELRSLRGRRLGRGGNAGRLRERGWPLGQAS